MKNSNKKSIITRREILFGGLSIFGASLSTSPLKTAAFNFFDGIKTENPLSGANLFRDVQKYSDLGEHRTATEVDLKTSAWIEKELKSAGFATQFQSFKTVQFFPSETSLKVAGKNYEAFPLWFPLTTNPRTLRAPLRKAGEQTSAHIALVKFPFDSRGSIFKGSGHAEIIEKAKAGGAVGIIAVTEGTTGEIIALNALSGTEPWSIPIVCVGGKDAAALEAAIAQNAEAEIVLQGKTERAAEAKNVIGKFGNGKKTVVVSTPQSGWFRCAGERGAGIAVFLGLARWAAQQKKLDANWIFVSTTGHEFAGLGMKAFLKDLAPVPKDVFAWLHLGANIAVWNYAQTDQGLKKSGKVETRRGIPAAAELFAPLKKAFAGTEIPVTDRAIGEVTLLLKDGYRAFGIVGANAFHHVRSDLPEVTAPELLEPVAAALTRSFDEIFAAAK